MKFKRVIFQLIICIDNYIILDELYRELYRVNYVLSSTTWEGTAWSH